MQRTKQAEPGFVAAARVALGLRWRRPTLFELESMLVLSSYECFWMEDHDSIVAA